MIISDIPINDKKDDLLNRAGFATNIADSIMSINAQEGLCISLEGPWGSGKSSILNLIINHLNEDHKNNLPQIIHFTPWNFITTDQLFKQFFCLLADVFADKKANRDIKIAEELHKYVGMIDSDFVNRYFCFDIGENDISQDEIDRFLYKCTYEEIIHREIISSIIFEQI